MTNTQGLLEQALDSAKAIWRRVRPPATVHEAVCKWCKHINMLIEKRQAGDHSMGVEVGLALGFDAHCERARELARREDGTPCS